ncbi:hypothetical protein LINPERPRIM_LOCUS33948, partial [Linum perenne]
DNYLEIAVETRWAIFVSVGSQQCGGRNLLKNLKHHKEDDILKGQVVNN